MRFADPAALLLLVLPLLELWRWRRRGLPSTHLAHPRLALLQGVLPGRRAVWARRLPLLRAAALTLGVVALARPQLAHDVREVTMESRNIVIALDISSSMKAVDFKPGNRLVAARGVLHDFVSERRGDLLGLVIFAGRAFLQAPLTPDEQLVGEMLDRVDIGLLPDGTAIGTALALSLNQLKELPPKAGVVILVTDGANNTGEPSPFVAAEAARALGIRIHTIGLGARDTLPTDGLIWRWGRQPDRLTTADEAVLRRISERTGGRYFRATDPEILAGILEEIDPMERVDVRIAEQRDYRELFPFLLLPAVFLVAAQLALGATALRSTP